jgi:ABC-type transport system substrate-binding protein
MYPGYATSAIPNLQKTEYNPTKAKQLLKDAGYPTGFKTSIHTFTRLVNRDWVTAIAKMLSDVGIQTTPDFPEAGKYEEYRGQGWTNSLMAHGFMSMDNLNSAFNLYFPQSNIAFPSVKKPAGFYDAVTKSITSPQVDPALLQAAFKLIADDLMVIPTEQIGVNFYKEGGMTSAPKNML